jgi:hypothetical protein
MNDSADEQQINVLDIQQQTCAGGLEQENTKGKHAATNLRAVEAVLSIDA